MLRASRKPCSVSLACDKADATIRGCFMTKAASRKDPGLAFQLYETFLFSSVLPHFMAANTGTMSSKSAPRLGFLQDLILIAGLVCSSRERPVLMGRIAAHALLAPESRLTSG